VLALKGVVRYDWSMLLRLADGETIADAKRRAIVLLVSRPELTITWSRYGARERGPDLHVHREHTDAFYVLEGEITFEVGPRSQRVRAAAGAFVAVPPDVVHTFANRSRAEASWLNIHAPDTGFAAYLRASRDGADAPWDSFDPPSDGGRPAGDAVVSGAGDGEPLGARAAAVKCALPELWVAELGRFEPHRHDDLLYELADGRFLGMRARVPGAR
jgi:mannose-6-phosphate isomerase-like protein (cupin superfamily)